ncbi:glycosyltransferase [Acidobacteria bacterium ACD]|nr:glycosyltransferase [Acidobacteria bacterium ACD]
MRRRWYAGRMRPLTSVVVPIRGEEPPSPAFLAALGRPGGPDGIELLVTADDSTPAAVLAAWEAAGPRVRTSPEPRGTRQREAARSATGHVLLFLHADTVLPGGWREEVEGAIASGAVAGAFRLAFEGGGARLALVALAANLRTALTRIPYGDQAPFVRRDAYERLGGHSPWPLLEDVDLFRRLRREGRVALLPDSVRTSPRRYLEKGILRTALTNRWVLLRFALGASPVTLARTYRS